MSGIILREAENLVDVTRLLDEESRKESTKKGTKKSRKEEPKLEAPVPWVAATTKPQLTQDWVDALNKAGNTGTLWRELTEHLPWYGLYCKRFM